MRTPIKSIRYYLPLLHHVPETLLNEFILATPDPPYDDSNKDKWVSLNNTLLNRFQDWCDFVWSVPAIIPLHNAIASVSLTSESGKKLIHAHPLFQQYLLASPSAFGIPYLAIQNESTIKQIYNYFQNNLFPVKSIDKLTNNVNSLAKSPSLAYLKYTEGIDSIPWKLFCDSPYMKHLIRGDLDIKPVPHPFLAGWTELQSLCLGHVPALIQVVLGTDKLKEQPMFLEVMKSLLHESIGNEYKTKNENRYPIMKTLILMHLAAQFLDSFATDPPEVIAWKYGFSWFPLAWEPNDPIHSTWTYSVCRQGAEDAAEKLSTLTAPRLSRNQDPMLHGLLAAIETLRQFFLQARAQDTPPWVILNLLTLGVGKSLKDWMSFI